MSIKIIVEGEELDIKTGIVGGVLNDGGKSPLGIYFGDKNMNSICYSLEYAIRSFIKTVREVESDFTLEQIELMISACTAFAMKAEQANEFKNNMSLDEYRAVKDLADRFLKDLGKSL